jgi:hypothetical protein
LEELNAALGDFRAWYNHVRPHQHLGGRTPAEAWAGFDPYVAAPCEVRYFSVWDGLLTGSLGNRTPVQARQEALEMQAGLTA